MILGINVNYQSYLPFFLSNYLRKLKYEALLHRNFFKYHGYHLNINQPETFNEKLVHRKYNCDPVELSNYADKIAVRDHIKNTVGEQYLIPLIGTYNKLTTDIWSSLPQRFVLKSSHGSGENHLHIVTDKTNCDAKKIIIKMNSGLKDDFGLVSHQPFYSVKKRMIIVEELLADGNIADFKFHCFQGKVFIQYDINRQFAHQRGFFDVNWNKLDMKLGNFSKINGNVGKPELLDEMLVLAKRLACNFNYIRVDLYCVSNKIYFGELTFTHGNGVEPFISKAEDKQWGEYWGHPI
jgi:hypothetical protein